MMILIWLLILIAVVAFVGDRFWRVPSAPVTFEFDQQPPITHRGTIAAVEARTIAARAIDEAQAAHPGLRWSSMNVVLLERLQDEGEVPAA